MARPLVPPLVRAFGLLLAVFFAVTEIHCQEVVDRIAARVENDIILQSDVRQLARYQQFSDGKSEDDEQVLNRLIDQWVVRSEAEASRFPPPSSAEIEQGLQLLQKSFPSPEEYEKRKTAAGVTEEQLRTQIATQLFLSNYLDSRFRPSVQVDPQAVEEFYKTTILPRAKARGQEPPALEASRETIQEALVQKSINTQADRWLKESRSRIHVKIFAAEAGQ